MTGLGWVGFPQHIALFTGDSASSFADNSPIERLNQLQIGRSTQSGGMDFTHITMIQHQLPLVLAKAKDWTGKKSVTSEIHI